MLNDGSAFYHSGRTVPTKFQLTAADGTIVGNAVANIQVFQVLATPSGTVDESVRRAFNNNRGNSDSSLRSECF